MFRRGGLLVLLIILSGCSRQIVVQPPIPTAQTVSPSQAKVGVFMKPTPLGSVTLNSGIWPATDYDFSPRESLHGSLVMLTRRHFPNSGEATSPVDKKFDYVIEYSCDGARVHNETLASQIPLSIVMRDPVSFKDIYSELVVGSGKKQPGRVMDVAMGRITERRALENSLNEASQDLLIRADASLAKMAINESELKTTKPYRRYESNNVSPMRRSRGR